MRNVGTFLDARLAKWRSQVCLFEVLQHSEGTISNPETGFCSHTAHGAVISLSPVPRKSSQRCCGLPVPEVAMLGLFSHLWASSQPLWVALPALLPTWLGAFGARCLLGAETPSRSVALPCCPQSPTPQVQPGRWASCRRAVCRGQRPSVTFLQHPLPPPPPLLNPGFPARLAGAGALVFRGEGGGSVRILSKGTEGPCLGGFRHFQAPIPTACDALCQPHAGPT